MVIKKFNQIKTFINQPISAAPLATFRILFGLMMLGSVFRFWYKGWIASLYIQPSYHFSYQGFEWVKPLGIYTYLIFAVCGLAALMVATGFKYKWAIVVFFLSFTYIELMDKTTYLNHYYFVSLVSFIMIFLPAQVYASVDAYKNRKLSFSRVPRWTIWSIKLMLCIVYFYAGLAKLNSDWLWHAAPLNIWLSTKTHLPWIGNFMDKTWFHYAMSWLGALYDLSIPFLLLNKKTRLFAFTMVVVFHVFTSILFPIGMFPYIMILSTLIFFSSQYHQQFLDFIFKIYRIHPPSENYAFRYPHIKQKLIAAMMLIFFTFQLLWPFRYLAYPGELFWTEEGFRFSWRVMLIEKAGYITFTIKDNQSNASVLVEPSDYLTPFQVKQMAFQPDFILEFAHYLAEDYKAKGFKNPSVYAQSYVALNGRRSTLYINPKIDLAQIPQHQCVSDWLIPFSDDIKGL